MAFGATKPGSKIDRIRPTSSEETQVTLLPNPWEEGDQMGTCISTVFTKAGRQMMKVLKGHKSACLTAGILMQGHPLPRWQSGTLNIVLEFTLNTTNKWRSLTKYVIQSSSLSPYLFSTLETPDVLTRQKQNCNSNDSLN